MLVLLSGVLICASACRQAESRDKAELVVSKWSEAIRNRDIDKALTLYAHEFFETTSAENWRNALETVQDKLGNLDSVKILNARTTSSLSFTGFHVRTEYDCEAKFAKGSARMHLAIVEETRSNDALIASHTILPRLDPGSAR
jgi:hypothetical protein